MSITCAECGGTGGRFRWIEDETYVHTPQCARNIAVLESGKNLYDFSSTNISTDPSKPVHVGSLRELRRLEKEHGVVSVVGNYDQGNWDR